MDTLSEQKQKQLQEFSSLSLEYMKKKLLLMIEQIDKNKIPALGEVAVALKESKFVDTTFCIGIYEEILLLMENMSEISAKRAQEKISSIHDKLKAMHEREAKEREEEDVESLLDNL